MLNNRSNMQQLMIPFPEFCQVANSENVPATSEQKTLADWLQEPSQFFSQFVGESISRLNAIYGSAAVVFSFTIVFIASVIGG